MKTGECVKLVNPDVEEGVDWLTIWKEKKGQYKVVLEKSSRIRTRVINSSAEFRKIIKLAEKSGYKMQTKGVELDKEGEEHGQA
jgi:hypothetical protein